jgi:hypothetical protein
MKISGFSMARNADKLYYPFREAILSVLPIVDEFVIAIGKGDPDDKTRKVVENIGSEKIRIIDTTWDLEKYPRGMENAHQTDIAKSYCTGDWLIYIQADEVIHEKYLQEITFKCNKYLEDKEVEGMLFKYMHFWGDYWHHQTSHHWYKREIRIIRNDPEIHSWESAQSFRRIPHFDGVSYRKKENTFKLKVVELDAYIYHYGWVRPPVVMVEKNKSLSVIHRANHQLEEMEEKKLRTFDYGPLNLLTEFTSSHPAVMDDRISRFDWREQLHYSGKPDRNRQRHAHERLRYRLVTRLKKAIPGLENLGEFRNYILLRGR